ncbi:MAG: efflux RND transporter periplasmic adaptor subunit [Deltaproteobacteria bacterium]|jgi:Cu(I)/Ag(I) efflux system membrane fusion protein|nr:efflux RND transporter periplasmic adaptor subunit [Deltaproteobacteria bacterium]
MTSQKIVFLVALALGLSLGLGLGALELGAGSQERQVLYWYDPMYPGTRFDQPGKSPFMDMDLVPRYADEATSGEGVRIDPTQTQNLGLRLARVRAGRLRVTRELPANVEFNGYQRARLQPRAEGFVASTLNHSVGDPIQAGEVLALITVPAWASDQSEYLLLKSQRADPRILAGVRKKLLLNGMPEEMLQEMERTGEVKTELAIKSPLPGALTQLDLYPGMNVSKNMTVAEIQGFDPIWVTAELPELDLPLAQGRVRVTTAAWPGRAFEVLSQTLLPQANEAARTARLRLTVANPEGLLRPGLTAIIRLSYQGPPGLLIPTQSLIDLGEDKRVITLAPDGTFLPKRVQVGGSAREETLISTGLNEGETVVVSGLFLIDSEANLVGALDRLRPATGSPLNQEPHQEPQVEPLAPTLKTPTSGESDHDS